VEEDEEEEGEKEEDKKTILECSRCLHSLRSKLCQVNSQLLLIVWYQSAWVFSRDCSSEGSGGGVEGGGGGEGASVELI